MILFYHIYNNCKNIRSKINNGKSNRNTVIVVKRFFSLAKTIVVDVIVIYIPRIPVVFFVMGQLTQLRNLTVEMSLAKNNNKISRLQIINP